MRLLLALMLLASLSADALTPPRADPAALFEGRSRGLGTLTFLLGKPRPFRVESMGRAQADGSFRLDQRILFEGEPARDRHWIIRPAGTGQYTFTLSDAAGAGTATVEGSSLTLQYPLGRGLSMRQVLDPARDGRTIANTGTIRWLGIPVGRLEETITRVK